MSSSTSSSNPTLNTAGQSSPHYPTDTVAAPLASVSKFAKRVTQLTRERAVNTSPHPLQLKLPLEEWRFMGQVQEQSSARFKFGDSGECLPLTVNETAENRGHSSTSFRRNWCFFCGTAMEGGNQFASTLAHVKSYTHRLRVAANPYRLATATADIYDITAWLGRSGLNKLYFDTDIRIESCEPFGDFSSRYQTGLERLVNTTRIAEISSVSMFHVSQAIGKAIYITPVILFVRPFEGRIIHYLTDFEGEMCEPEVSEVLNGTSRLQFPFEIRNNVKPGIFLLLWHLLFIDRRNLRRFQRGVLLQVSSCSERALIAEKELLSKIEGNTGPVEGPDDLRWHPDVYEMPPLSTSAEGIIPMVLSRGVAVRQLPKIFQQWKSQFWPLESSRGVVEWPQGRQIYVLDHVLPECSHFDNNIMNNLFTPQPVTALNLAKRCLAEAYGQAVFADVNVPMAGLLSFQWYMGLDNETCESDRIIVDAEVPTQQFEQLKIHGELIRFLIPTENAKAFAVITSHTKGRKQGLTNVHMVLSVCWKRALQNYNNCQDTSPIIITPEAGIPSQFIIRTYLEMLEDINVVSKEQVDMDMASAEDVIIVDDADQPSLDEFPPIETTLWQPEQETNLAGSRREQYRATLAAAYKNVHVPFMERCVGDEVFLAPTLIRPELIDDNMSTQLNNMVKQLDCGQRNILDSIELNNRRVIAHGAPGSGKSRTLAIIMVYLAAKYPNIRILAVAPTNQAANVLAQKVVRMMDDDLLNKSSEEKVAMFMRYVCRSYPTDFLDPSLRPYVNTENSTLTTILGSQIVVSTVDLAIIHFLNCLEFFKTSSGTDKQLKSHFDLVIVDEAANLTVARGVLVSLLSASGRLLLVGDDRQLPAYVTDPVSLAGGASESFWELSRRFATASSRGVIIKLTNNYRSRAEIIQPSNEELYREAPMVAVNNEERKNQLLSEVEKNKKILEVLPTYLPDGIPYGLSFHSVLSSSKKYHKSSYNVAHADVAVGLALSLIEKGIEPSRIAIDGCYAAQVLLINSMLRMVQLYPKVRAQTANTLQGAEADFVIITLVKGNVPGDRLGQRQKHGFLDDQRRLNVSLTRARLASIVIGSPLRFTTHPLLSKYLHLCCENGSLHATSRADWGHLHYMTCELPRLPDLETAESETEPEKLWLNHIYPPRL